MRLIKCITCGKQVEAKSNRQKYCVGCLQEKERAYYKKYREKNKEKSMAYGVKYWEKNKEKLCQTKRDKRTVTRKLQKQYRLEQDLLKLGQ